MAHLDTVRAVSALARFGIERPVVQAGMGGGISGHELAAAVSAAGGLGTIGMLDPRGLREEIAAARALTDRPLAVNLLLPFARAAHWRSAAAADLVVTFWGEPRRRGDGPWVHQAGSVDEALRACDAGADAVIVQGVEAGGHVRGSIPALELLAQVRERVGEGFPLWLAGGIADGGDVRRALAAGAEAAVLGTRFLMTEESHAHPGYKARLIAARETQLTKLFGAGWPGQHRVVHNAATGRWGGGPQWMHRLNAAAAPLLRVAPQEMAQRLAVLQRPGSPVLMPLPPVADGPENLLESGPLYAGETVARIDDIRPAGELVAELSGTPRSR